MLKILRLALLLVVGLSAARGVAQPVYRAGDIIENFSLINRRTGQPMQLSDFVGKILFLDFFAHWCPVCNAAAPQLESGIYQRYREAGNAAGLPVVYVLCNLQGDFTPRDAAGTAAFTSRFGSDAFVLEDNNRALQHRFTSASGQPTFAVINGVANSASHRQWELVYSLHGYTSPGRVQPIGEFQAAIDSVRAPAGSMAVLITGQPQNQVAPVGATVSLTVTAIGSEPIHFQWKRDDVELPGAVGPTLELDNLQPSDAGDYQVVVSNGSGSVTSAIATVTVLVPPVIVSQPESRTVVEGGSTTFTSVSNGSAPLNYQWRFNGASIPGALNPSLTVERVRVIDAGAYTVLVTNPAGSVESAAALLTVIQPVAIVVQPHSRSVRAGETVTFTVEATGTKPLTYQWNKNDQPISGATAATLVLEKVASNESGDYTVVVTNPATSVTSAPATLTVEANVGIAVTLTRAQRAADGAFEFEFLGTPGRTYRIEVSMDLNEWTPLTTVGGGTAPQLVRDSTVSSSSRRYYRVVSE
ncbi:MAG: immunoglobulin domain-containing protein [Verrucomicrobiales bacterium]|nr:immunoglobulin domain-containing protein [Verrucomicrobiales bacterium]